MSFQITWLTSRILNVSGLVMMLTPSRPISWKSSATGPAPPRIFCQIAITITQEMKWGR